MNGAIADPAVRTISTPKVSKIKISGNNQNFFLTRRKPQRSLMNSIISFSFLIRFLYVFPSENMISNDHYRIFTRLESPSVCVEERSIVKSVTKLHQRGRASGSAGERTPRWEIKPAHNDQSRGVVIFPGIHRS